ncbi:hypothetical protein [Streptomyces sp. NPDC060065]|uniref:hypothetical protein n=1 Tax=Streptomyces sp. NPDC060065 TaxID=3347050 RepID=UPI0036B64DF8
MTSHRRHDDALEIRLVAQSPDAGTAVVQGPFTSAQRVDLLGRTGAPVEVEDGAFHLPLRP